MKQNKKQNTYRIKQFSLFVLIAFSFFLACMDDVSSAGDDTETEALPNTVEAVAMKWLMDYNKNQFAEAKKLSTPATIEMIDTISMMIAAMGAESMPFKISGLNCKSQADSASCSYFYQEPEYEFEDSVFLKKLKGQWLVNMPLIEDDGLMEGDLERMFEMSEEALEKVLKKQ